MVTSNLARRKKTTIFGLKTLSRCRGLVAVLLRALLWRQDIQRASINWTLPWKPLEGGDKAGHAKGEEPEHDPQPPGGAPFCGQVEEAARQQGVAQESKAQVQQQGRPGDGPLPVQADLQLVQLAV